MVAPPKKLIGCILMWWNNDDKIIRNHEVGQIRVERCNEFVERANSGSSLFYQSGTSMVLTFRR